jgi:hypothetical protein
MNICLYCGKDVKNKYCNVSCQNKHQNKNKFKQRNIRLYGELKEFEVNCSVCNKKFFVKEIEKEFPVKLKYYCNRSCANVRFPTKKNKQKTKQNFKKILSSF